MDFRNIKVFFIDLIKYALVVVCVVVVVVYVATLQQVVGSSMEPNYYDGSILFLDKILYKVTDLRRNDVISFKYEDTKYLIKRIIGLPGEKIEYKDNYLYINGVKYKETITEIETTDFKLEDIAQVEFIPDDMYLVLGDNRINSLDSRSFGLVKKEDIIGRVAFQIWPLIKRK